MVLLDGSEIRSESPRLFVTPGNGPWPAISFFAIAVLAAVVLRMTRYGRYVIAVGANERAAIYSAVNVDRVKLLTYTLVGGCCGIAALLLASRMNSIASSSAGVLYELDAIAAVAIGGTRMRGGSGSIFGTVVGVLILGVIGNMLGILNVSPYLQGTVKGGIIIAAVLVQRVNRRGNE
jgi:ribose transport system permease protein